MTTTATRMVLAITLLIPLTGLAGLTTIPQDQAATAAHNWLQYSREMHWHSTNTDVPPALQELWHEGQLVGYLAAVEGGFVVLPAYQELPPVTAYSFSSTFYVDDDGGFVQMVKEALAGKIEVARIVANAAQITPEMEDAAAQIRRDRIVWQDYTASYSVFRRAVEAATSRGPLDDTMDVGPLLQTAWRQTAPYNNFCPQGDGGRTLVGCVATAAAQIVNYWHSAASAAGSRSYTWNGDQSCGNSTPSQTLTATYGDGYDWSNMLNVYTSGYSPAQADAVAELCYEVAVAVSMDFGRCSSGASTASVANALPQYFGMASGANVQYRNAYSTADAWFAMLQSELTAGRPMQYRIYSHSIVCDGWRLNGGNQVHLNYGWGNSYTAWYTVDALYCPWSGCSPQVEYAVRNIQPVGAPPAPAITVTAPNGNENWQIGGSRNITWTSQSVNENVQIEINRGFPSSSWEVLNASVANTGMWTWAVSGEVSSAARVRVRAVSTPSLADTSNANFTIAEPPPPVPQITVLSPNGGQSWAVGSTQSITWSSESLTENVTVELNRRYPQGSWEVLVADIPNSGVWSWTINGNTTTKARIRVRSVSQSAVDVSNANFAISAPQPAITVLSPNGGEDLVLNTQHVIAWSSTGLSGNVRIQINRNYPSGPWQNIVNNTPNDGEHTWTVSGAQSASVRIRISSGSTVTDVSDANFRVSNGQFSPGEPLPGRTEIASVFPNPFNPTARVGFHLAEAGPARLELFDLTGRRVAILADGDFAAGSHAAILDGRMLATGVYIVRFQAAGVQQLRKVHLIK